MNRLLPILICCLMPSISHAQPELDIALKAGPNAATQDEDLRVNRYGVTGGISSYLQWSLSERFLLGSQVELLYTPRGAAVVSDGQEIGKIREHYIDVAIAARPEIRWSHFSLYFLLGGSLNFLMSASRDDATVTGQDITSGLHRFDIAVLGATGISLHVDSNKRAFGLNTVFLEARHDIGLLDVNLDGGFKNRTSSVMLGLSFVMGGSPATNISSTTQTTDQLKGHSASRW